MLIIFNGNQREIENDSTIARLIQISNLDISRVAVEVNRKIIPRSLHSITILKPGDTVEILEFVGGG